MLYSHSLSVHMDKPWQQVRQGFTCSCLSNGYEVVPAQQHWPCLRLVNKHKDSSHHLLRQKYNKWHNLNTLRAEESV